MTVINKIAQNHQYYTSFTVLQIICIELTAMSIASFTKFSWIFPFSNTKTKLVNTESKMHS